MEFVLTEWLSLVIRWLHVVAGIAWIGSSFYFIHLDLSLKARAGLPDGVKGDAWQVHGGGFYHMVKYLVAPARMPDELTWFKWEAYTTWLSGFALMVDRLLSRRRAVPDRQIGARHAAGDGRRRSAFGTLLSCVARSTRRCAARRSAATRRRSRSLGYVFLVALTYGFTHVFSGRGAFIQIGALIGTIMVANVFVIIIPNQSKVVAALIAGKEPEARLGDEGKQRSVHNNYLTLPVVFLMIGNHYPLLFATRYNWLDRRDRAGDRPGHPPLLQFAPRGQGQPVVDLGRRRRRHDRDRLAVRRSARASDSGATAVAQVDFAAAADIVISRCSMCHAAEPVWPGITTAPKGVLLDTPSASRVTRG